MDVEAVPLRARAKTPSRLLQVYVDDFCNAATQSIDESHIPSISRASIHSIHSVFPLQKSLATRMASLLCL